jgi:hypothetical protein
MKVLAYSDTYPPQVREIVEKYKVLPVPMLVTTLAFYTRSSLTLAHVVNIAVLFTVT